MLSGRPPSRQRTYERAPVSTLGLYFAVLGAPHLFHVVELATANHRGRLQRVPRTSEPAQTTPCCVEFGSGLLR